jgi:hypothetical protein
MTNDLISQWFDIVMVWYCLLVSEILILKWPKPTESVLHINSSHLHTSHEIGRSVLVFNSRSQMHNALNLNATKTTLCSQFKSVASNATTIELEGL